MLLPAMKPDEPASTKASLPYWICQGTVWSLYAAGAAVPYLPNRVAVGRVALYALAVATTGIAETHAFRTHAKKHGWERLDLRRLIPRVLASSLLMGALMNLFWILGEIHYFERHSWAEARRDLGWLLLHWLGRFFPVFLGWETLYFAFQFVRRARRAELEKLRIESQSQAAQLRLLKAQLNPHFLFNALNGLRGLIAEDPSRAQTMVTHLSAVLRYSLSSTRGLVTLGRELDVVDDYLALESIRLEDRLRVRMDVDPAALAVPVPPMLVQGLVENGIKHGVALLPEGGDLTVSARVTDTALELTVTNTAAPARPANQSGIGLANAREQLRLLFGEGASLQLDEGVAGVITARVVIPRAAA